MLRKTETYWATYTTFFNFKLRLIQTSRAKLRLSLYYFYLFSVNFLKYSEKFENKVKPSIIGHYLLLKSWQLNLLGQRNSQGTFLNWKFFESFCEKWFGKVFLKITVWGKMANSPNIWPCSDVAERCFTLFDSDCCVAHCDF